MTTRKSNNRAEAKGKPVKTIDLTAEEVTKSEAPETDMSSTEAPETQSDSDDSAKVEQGVSEDKSEEPTVASDGPDEKTSGKDPVDEEARSAVEESAASDDGGSTGDIGTGEKKQRRRQWCASCFSAPIR